jgi:hypothetical protein
MRKVFGPLALALATAAVILPAGRCGAPTHKTQNILLVTTDGLRWQEVFAGADDALMNRGRGGVQNLNQLRKDFWRETPDERRHALLPFTTGVLAKDGQLFGNRSKGSIARVTNGNNFSYPGYSELLCGVADTRIDSNEKKLNPNLNVLEWLYGKDAFKDRIAVFSSWDVMSFVLNAPRSGLPVNAGWQPLTGLPASPRVDMLNELTAESPMFGEDTRNDALTFRAAKEYLLAKRPRVLYVAFDQTDEQGHAGRYDRVLGCAHKVDQFVKDLWETMQTLPGYRGTTTLIFTTDHGRGDPPVDWKNHGKRTAGSEAVWAGFLGPDTPPMGERKNAVEITHVQIASTLAALLGEDFRTAVPGAGKPIADVIGWPGSLAEPAGSRER